MTIKEKIQYSEDKTVFTLFKEGLFYKCYNADAMMFVQRLSAYKQSTTFIKRVGYGLSSSGVCCLQFFKTRRGLKRIALNDRSPNL